MVRRPFVPEQPAPRRGWCRCSKENFLSKNVSQSQLHVSTLQKPDPSPQRLQKWWNFSNRSKIPLTQLKDTHHPSCPFSSACYCEGGVTSFHQFGNRRLGMSAETILITLILVGVFGQVRPDAFNHKYKKGDLVPFYANKVGPYFNPSETYAYYEFPFCRPDHWQEKKESLGELLSGDRLVSTPYKLYFRVNTESQVACRKTLTRKEVSKFQTALMQDYYLEMYYDDLPLWAFFGRVDKEKPSKYKYFLHTKFIFEIRYNGDRVVEISCIFDTTNLTELTVDKVTKLELFYSVNWKETAMPFEKRLERYSMSAHLPGHLKVHGLGIINSSWTILILVGCLAVLYVRVLRRDFNESATDEESVDNHEETGWKIIHGDVFRYPKHKCFFAATIGSGTQLLTGVVSIIILGMIGIFQPYDRGVLKVALVITYAITNVIAGFASVSLYHQLEGSNQGKSIFLAGCVFSGPMFLTFCFLNTVAMVYGSTTALPLGIIVVIILIFILLALPLLLLGGIFEKMIKSEFQAPCRTSKSAREIPVLRWYRGVLPQMALAGFLPFSVSCVELYYIFNSVWGHRVFTLYAVLFIIFILLLTTTALVSIGLTYFQLAAEDYHWWWRSFLCGGSTALYVYAYCFYYYFERSAMSGFLQTSFFFGYMACICYGLFLLLGAVGFRASLVFVRYIYSSIKCE